MDERDGQTTVDRQSLGRTMFAEVYGDLVPAPPPGGSEAFEMLIIEQQFAEIWSRRALSVPLRRLLTMGVVTARGEYQTLQLQFRASLDFAELTAEQVRECAMHLISYAGTPASGGVLAAAEAAIADHQRHAEADQ